ncbi:hypothetical protein Psuf_091660 [Phytohabitans suffuscus]|uniref:Major facilitator superfamily (MFS) profile domain-containing protein n=1 Tax=Phytohabitans suffuscus TaxID=624315 RepID=A0A6F8Z0S8_9ACTN|nr:hypothetical protein Psuf_091660 [Phytohabitans suffuscus]
MTQVTAIGVGPEGPGPEGPAPEGSAPEGTAWANRDFRRLWLGSAVSSFGSEVAELALPLLALVTLSASAAEVGLLRVAQFLPFLLATLPLGVLVDRHRRRRLSFMVGADLGRFALLAVIPLGIWAGVARVELLYVVVFAAGILTVLYQIADFAFLPSLVRTDQLVDANGKIAATQSANEIGGRGLGGLIVQAASARWRWRSTRSPSSSRRSACAASGSNGRTPNRRTPNGRTPGRRIWPATPESAGRRGPVGRGRRPSKGCGRRWATATCVRCWARRPRSTCSTRCSSSG